MICETHRNVKAPLLCPVCLYNEVAQLQAEIERLKEELEKRPDFSRPGFDVSDLYEGDSEWTDANS